MRTSILIAYIDFHSTDLSVVDGFLQDLKLQAQRDLEGAEIILEQNGPVEHVAWFCEQSFEKTAKYVYAYFKLKIQSGTLDSVHDKMRERAHFGTGDLIINMLREIYGGSGQLMLDAMLQMAKLPENIQLPLKALMDKIPKNYIGFLDRSFDKARDKIATLLGDKMGYNKALKNSTAQHIRWYLEKFDFDEKIDKIVKAEVTPFAGVIDINAFANPELYQKNINFPVKVLGLSPWLLPYAEMSRYPLKECGYVNLQGFREYEAPLKQYFAALIDILKGLQKDGDGYIESMNAFKQAAQGIT